MILVTGGFGFIGSHTVRALLDAGEDCVVTQHSARPVPYILQSELGSSLHAEHVDLTDGDELLALGDRYPISGVVHLADPAVAQIMNSLSSTSRPRFSQLLVGLGNVLDASMAWGVARATIASTIGVYAETGDGPWGEDRRLPLASVHGIPAMKKIAETLGSFAAAHGGLGAVFVRPSFIWGPGARPASFISPLPELAHAAVRGTQSFPSGQYFAEDAADICYVKDCAKALALLQLAPTLNHSTYNIGGGGPITNAEIVESIRSVVPDFTATLSSGSSLEQPSSAFLDLTRLYDDTGYQADYGFNAGMTDYVGWLRDGHER